MKEVHSECYGFISEACSRNAHKKLGLSYEETESCVNSSFDGSNHDLSDNHILKDHFETWRDYGTFYWPSVTINRSTFRGDITVENIVEDICASLAIKPKVCIDFYEEENIKYEITTLETPSTISAEMLLVVVVVLVSVNVLLIIAYRRCAKKEMK